MKTKLFSNLGLKLLAILLGFIVWLVVLNLDDYVITKQIKDIPVEILNEEAITDQNQLYDITEGETVDIIVKGRRSVVNDLLASDFLASADLSKLSLTNAVPITVTARDEIVQNDISITIVNSVLVVELEEEDTVSLPVSVVTKGDVAEGYTVGVAVATPNLITVSGAASVINNIDRVEVEVDVTDRTTDASATCVPVFYDKQGEQISDKKLECEISTVDVTVPVYRTKAVPVKLSTSGTPAEMYEIVDIEYVPSTITIGGPTDVLKSITAIEIGDIDVTDCTDDLETTVDVTKYLPENVVVADDNILISVHVTIERNISRSIAIDADDITILNKSQDTNYDIQFSEDSSVTVTGLTDIVSALTAKDLNLEVDAAELTYGTNYVTLEIEDSEDYTTDGPLEVIISVTSMP